MEINADASRLQQRNLARRLSPFSFLLNLILDTVSDFCGLVEFGSARIQKVGVIIREYTVLIIQDGCEMLYIHG